METHELEQILFEELGYAGRQELLRRDDIPWNNGRLIPEVDAAVFLKSIPVAYFSQFTKLNPDKIKELHKKIWSQSKVPLLFVTLPHEIRIYNCYEPVLYPGEDLDSQTRLLEQLSNLSDELTARQQIRSRLVQANHYERIYLETGEFWNTESGKRINHQNRADRHLVEGMAKMRSLLTDSGLSNHIAYTLLGRSIFIRYLEHRGALSAPMIHEMTNGQAHSYPEALSNRSVTYRLFRSLSDRFHGDLFPIEEDESRVSQEHLNILSSFLQGTNLATGQLSLWPFNFEFIPIELISHIYDTFIEDQRTSGAYYTPLLLADFVLEETMGDDVINHAMTCLDPACGSGIFLVGAYRRLIQEWRRKYQTNPKPQTLNKILQQSIFGVDKHSEAVRIAAFSLYLEILNHLTNRQIQDGFQFSTLLGTNLFSNDFFSEEINQKLHNKKFDRIIGNMPWGVGTQTVDTQKWLSERKLIVGKKQAAPAFMLKVPEFCKEDGEIALIVPAKSTILVTSKTNQQFRNNFFSKYSVRAVVNFSAMVYELFAGAISPAVAIFYSVNAPNFDDKLVYGTPKPSPLSHRLKAILLDTTEIKFLNIKELSENPHLWKIALWGTPRDVSLIEKLTKLPTLFEQCKKLGWELREGFMAQYEGSDRNQALWLHGMPFVSATNFNPYLVKTTEIVEDKVFHRQRSKDVFKAPLVLIHHSNCQAAFSNVDVAFLNSISGISGKRGQKPLMKWLVCLINSPLIRYYQFLTSTRWAIERGNPLQKEYEAIPFVLPDTDNPDLQKILYHFEQISQLTKRVNGFFMRDNQAEIEEHQKAINSLVYKIYGISPVEQQLIDDMLIYGLGFFTWAKQKNRQISGEKSVQRPDENLLSAYAKTFARTVSSVLKVKGLGLNATVYKNGAPLTVVSFSLTDELGNEQVEIVTQPDTMRRKLRELDNLLIEQKTPSMYMRRHVRIYDGSQISLVRPSEKRFWTQTQARVDADSFLAELSS